MSKKGERLCAVCAALLALLQGIAIIGSWFLAMLFPHMSFHSLLSSEGIRWFFGHFADNLATPLLVWMVLGGMAYGACQHAWNPTLRSEDGKSAPTYRTRLARRVALAELVVCVGIYLWLAFAPHAILASATGGLLPSSFSRSLVPVVAFVATLCAASYGALAGRYPSPAAIFRALCAGVRSVSPFFVLYVLGATLYASLRFILNLS